MHLKNGAEEREETDEEERNRREQQARGDVRDGPRHDARGSQSVNL